jgi:glycosyltransferase involved in cell wall biosynthesis
MKLEEPDAMKIVHILHHSISPFAGQYPEDDPLHYNSGLTMKYARAIRARYPKAEIECWRPERVARQVYVWHDEATRITHRVFPSLYGRYNLEYSHAMLQATRHEADRGEVNFLVQGSYNLHAYLLASILRAAPAILQSHGGFPARVLFHRSRHRWLRHLYLIYAPIEQRTIPRYRHIFAISHEERAYLTGLCPDSAVHFSPTGIDFKTFSPGDCQAARSACGLAADGQVLLYVGRLSAEKGLEYLIKAFALVFKRLDPAPRLVIIGSGPLRDALQIQAQELGVAQFVVFTGNLPSHYLPQWYRAADLTVVPSLLEWFGAVAVESLACGTPIVGTDAGGLVDIVAEFECGLLVPPHDSEALAEAIIGALTNASLPQPNIARGREAFDWSVKIAHMVNLWANMRENTESSNCH